MSRLKTLNDEYQTLRGRLEQGGGAERIKRQHDQGKLTARERVAALLDPDGPWIEIGLLVAWDQYDGQAPAAGVVTGVGRVGGRPVVVVANDATCRTRAGSSQVNMARPGSSTTTPSCGAISRCRRSRP